jgi:predicted DNA-binding transcriptional regulator YafY
MGNHRTGTAAGRAKGAEKLKRLQFILRRACWYGRVTVRDVQEAFGVSRQIAGLDLHDAVQHWTTIVPGGEVRRVLMHATRAVVPVYPVRPHEQASPATMLRLLAAGAPFSESGLRSSEVDVLFPADRTDTIDQEVLTVMLQAVVDKSGQGLAPRPVVVEYVGMKLGDVYRQRKIVPTTLEFDGAQTRIYAHDLDAKDYPVKAFVLTRMKSARFSDEALPKDLVRKGVSNLGVARFRLTFDPRLTEDQKSALQRELGIRDGIVAVPESRAHAFKRFYTNGMPQDGDRNVVWPPIIFAESVE